MNENQALGRLAQRINDLRQQAGLSQSELARRSGINRSQLTRIMNGETTQPSTDTLNHLAQVLGVDPEDFYDAIWTDSNEPLPSLPTYFRNKYHLTDQQIAAVQQTIDSTHTDRHNPAGTIEG